jgi:hypothetical protein
MLDEGSATMGVWLGKQYLGQRDEIDINGSQVNCVVVFPGSPVPVDKSQTDEQVHTIDVVKTVGVPRPDVQRRLR